jgi:hypothetical protein
VARGRDAGDRESGVRARGRSRRVGGGLVLCFVFFFPHFDAAFGCCCRFSLGGYE